jgi:hypothetical protein
MIQICAFKKKEKEGGERRPQLGGPWREKEKHPFHFFSLSPKQILLNFFCFPLILRFYFTMVIDYYLHLSFLFLDP